MATLATATPVSFACEGSAHPSRLRSSSTKSVVVSAPEDVASGVAPLVEQFSFTLTTVSASSTTASASTVTSEWTRAYRGASRLPPCSSRRPSKCKIAPLQEDDDVPLLQRCKEHKRQPLFLMQKVEAVDECLLGSSVVDPLSTHFPALTSIGGGEIPPVSSPWTSHNTTIVEEMPPVCFPQPNSGSEAMLVSDPACHSNAQTEGSEMPPVSSPTLSSETGAMPASVSIENNNTNSHIGSGATSVPVPVVL